MVTVAMVRVLGPGFRPLIANCSCFHLLYETGAYIFLIVSVKKWDLDLDLDHFRFICKSDQKITMTQKNETILKYFIHVAVFRRATLKKKQHSNSDTLERNFMSIHPLANISLSKIIILWTQDLHLKLKINTEAHINYSGEKQ